MPMTNSDHRGFFQKSAEQRAAIIESGAADHDFEVLLSDVPELSWFDAQETVDNYAKPIISFAKLMLKMAAHKANGSLNNEELLAHLFTCSDEWDEATAQLEASMVNEDEEAA